MKENGLSTLCPTPITNLWAGHLFSPGGCGRFSGSVPKPPANLLPSLAQPFLFSFSTLYLSLPLLFPIVIVQTTMAGGAEEEERTEEADITKAISRMAHSMRRACRVCGQFAIAGRLLRFGERLRCCRCWPPQRGTDSAQTPLTSASRFPIPSFGLTRRQISEEGEVFFAH